MTKKTYYKVCEHCGAALDPCERCDCEGKVMEAEPMEKAS